MVRLLEKGVLLVAMDADNNITISDTTLHKIIPTRLKKMTLQYNSMCGCENFISDKTMHS